MPIQLIPIVPTSVGYPDGYLVRAAVTIARFGPFNAAASIDLDNDGSNTEMQATWAEAVEGIEGYFDSRARVYQLTADSDAPTGKMYGATNPFYARIRYLASLDMIPELYEARGINDATTGPEGQMTTLRKQVRDELDTILEALAIGATEVSGGIDGITVIGCPTTRACLPYGGCGVIL
jgi:hypothetical protein